MFRSSTPSKARVMALKSAEKLSIEQEAKLTIVGPYSVRRPPSEKKAPEKQPPAVSSSGWTPCGEPEEARPRRDSDASKAAAAARRDEDDDVVTPLGSPRGEAPPKLPHTYSKTQLAYMKTMSSGSMPSLNVSRAASGASLASPRLTVAADKEMIERAKRDKARRDAFISASEELPPQLVHQQYSKTQLEYMKTMSGSSLALGATPPASPRGQEKPQEKPQAVTSGWTPRGDPPPQPQREEGRPRRPSDAVASAMAEAAARREAEAEAGQEERAAQVGTLTVRVIGARNLPWRPSHRSSAPTPDACATLSNRRRGMARLCVMERGAAPVHLGGRRRYCLVELAGGPSRRTPTAAPSRFPAWDARLDFEGARRSTILAWLLRSTCCRARSPCVTLA
jgi:hypothetical protein